MEIVLSLMLIALVYALFKMKHSPPDTRENHLKYMPYAAVKIEACDFSCSGAFECSSHVFLKREAPKLPLESCDSHTRCSCRFIHLEDRRQHHEDRRSGSRILQDTFRGDERRSTVKRGRRITDYQTI